MIDMIQDGVRVFHLPDDNFCLADEKHRSPLDMEECPRGEEHCTGDCFYYSEDPEDRKKQFDEKELRWGQEHQSNF